MSFTQQMTRSAHINGSRKCLHFRARIDKYGPAFDGAQRRPPPEAKSKILFAPSNTKRRLGFTCLGVIPEKMTMRESHMKYNIIFIIMLSIFVFLRGWNTSSAQMPFNGWDEFNHVAVSYHVHLYGSMPLKSDAASIDLFPLLCAHPQPIGSYPMFADISKLYPGLVGIEGNNSPCKEWKYKIFDLYEAQHGPLFYHLLSKFVSGNRSHALLAWMDTGRLFNIILFVFTVISWHFILINIFYKYDMPILTYGGTLLFASYSIAAFNFARFSNDSLSLFFGALAIYFYVVFIKEKIKSDIPLISLFFLGLLSGIAVLSKATVIILVPTFIIAIAFESLRRRHAKGLISILAFTLGYLLITGGYHLRNYEMYGVISGMQESVINSSHGLGTIDALKLLPQLPWNIWNGDHSMTSNPIFYYLFTFIGGWSNIRNPWQLSAAFDYCIKISLGMLFFSLFIPKIRNRLLPMVYNNMELPLSIIFCTLALLYHALQSLLASGISQTGSWYGMIVLPLITAGLLLGPALFSKIISFVMFISLLIIFNYSHYQGLSDLLRNETGIYSLQGAINDVATHHVIFKYNIFVSLMAEVVFIIALSLFCAMKIFRDTHSGMYPLPPSGFAKRHEPS
ncbi:MAG: glycosyltransferase family 39 protein [Desulfovibrionaceae bacterium]|nr:glycosyltransferase family 39 protein [Desulfovibrionaceae bacterium]MBF0512543.1 glycosyltransferase family 39 protein [Desulfovibrionaceae bacterium]